MAIFVIAQLGNSAGGKSQHGENPEELRRQPRQSPRREGRRMAPCARQIPGGNKAALLPTFLTMEMDVATRDHVLSFTEDCYNSMKRNNIGKKLVFMSFPPSSFLLG